MATKKKTWNVANRLHSLKDSDNPEVNHIIAGADEIYDDTKGAKQSTINAQTDSRLSTVESDINEPASGVKDRLTTLEEQVEFEGEIQVENDPAGIVSGSGKVATANAVRGAIDAANDVHTSGAYATDLDIADEQGNVLMRMSGGHVKTKNFDSSTIDEKIDAKIDANKDPVITEGEMENVLTNEQEPESNSEQTEQEEE